MLFALYDYVCYRFQLRHYAPAVVEAQHARLAISENFPEEGVRTKCEPGDAFFLHTRNSFVSWLIMYYTNSLWSHVGAFAENGKIVDATTSGVIKHEFLDYIDGESYILLKKLDKSYDLDTQKMMEFAERQVGSPYNWAALPRIFIHIVSGRDPKYRIRYTLDFLLLLLPFLLLRYSVPVVGWIAVTCGAILVLFVGYNVAKRKWSERRSTRDHEDSQRRTRT